MSQLDQLDQEIDLKIVINFLIQKMPLIYGFGCKINVEELMEGLGVESFDELQSSFEDAGLRVFRNDDSGEGFVVVEDEYQEFDLDFAWKQLEIKELADSDRALLKDYAQNDHICCILFNASSSTELIVDSTLFDTMMNQMTDTFDHTANAIESLAQ